MMNNTWKNQYKYPSGTIVNGKWHKNEYRLVKVLGEGANGVVYLAKGSEGYSALKMSTDSFSITSEVNVLKAFAKVQGSALGPSLIDVDDWAPTSSIRVHFYVMEYIQGPDLLSFIRQKGNSWAVVMIVQLLDVLDCLHEQGWIFGDLKPENLIVTGHPARIRCIDVGGTTLNGRAIKEFTEFFDRGYWGQGSRKAEPSYDLSSTAMVMINLFYPNRFERKDKGEKQLLAAIRSNESLRKFEVPLRKAIKGEYVFAHEMKKEMLEAMAVRSSQRPPTPPRQQFRKQKRGTTIETAAIVVLSAILYAIYIVGQLL